MPLGTTKAIKSLCGYSGDKIHLEDAVIAILYANANVPKLHFSVMQQSFISLFANVKPAYLSEAS